ncbi:hypothetical protein ACFO5R_15630 [Halosolutus amylolyticus]|uniref:Small CPxCG-related zinc finger protein n=1 Tax=Halosolutus amylolyticus TaxID=2932267 RepID=A0ABD5PS00_9EURY|nr:hypothetical protein [Halosolutus amylolyticus]
MKISSVLPDSIGRHLDDADRSGVHYECRRCGTTLSDDRGSCPACGSGDVAAIPL